MEDILGQFKEYQQIYTAYYTNNIAAGSVAKIQNKEDIMVKLPNWYTTKTYQAIPVLLAIDYAMNHEGKFIIFTDLKIKQQKSINNTLLINEIIEKTLKSKQKIIICSIPTKYLYKTPLTRSAKLASELNFSVKNRKVDFADIQKLIKRLIFSEWNHLWANNTNLHLNKIRTNLHDRNPAQNFNRKEQITITRLRIGHSIATHQHLLNKSSPPICDKCSLPITVEHILLSCMKFENERRKCNIQDKSLKDILNNSTECAKVLQFLNSVKLQNVI